MVVSIKAEQFRVMAFARLNYPERLRDIEVRLSAQDANPYHTGFREPIRRSQLADANASRECVSIVTLRCPDRPDQGVSRFRESLGT